MNTLRDVFFIFDLLIASRNCKVFYILVKTALQNLCTWIYYIVCFYVGNCSHKHSDFPYEKQKFCLLLALLIFIARVDCRLLVAWLTILSILMCVCTFKASVWDGLYEHYQGWWPSLCCLDFLGSYYIVPPSILMTHEWLAARTAVMDGVSWIVFLHLWKHALHLLSFLLLFLPFLA